MVNTVDAFSKSHSQPPGTQVVRKKNNRSWDITYQPQVVNPGFLNHQQYHKQVNRPWVVESSPDGPPFLSISIPSFHNQNNRSSTKVFFTWKWPSSTQKKKTFWIRWFSSSNVGWFLSSAAPQVPLHWHVAGHNENPKIVINLPTTPTPVEDNGLLFGGYYCLMMAIQSWIFWDGHQKRGILMG